MPSRFPSRAQVGACVCDAAREFEPCAADGACAAAMARDAVSSRVLSTLLLCRQRRAEGGDEPKFDDAGFGHAAFGFEGRGGGDDD